MPFDALPSSVPVFADMFSDEGDVARYLRRAWSFIDAPEKWCQGEMFATRAVAPPRLQPLSSLVLWDSDTLPEPPMVNKTTVTAFCTAGALSQAREELSLPWHCVGPAAERCLYDTLPSSFRKPWFSEDARRTAIVNYNDAHQWPTIARWWQRAIALATKREMLGRYRPTIA
jgi:hypothetical protein